MADKHPPVRLNASNIVCSEDYFQCDDGTCIALQHVCDGEHDCVDFSDEQNCTCNDSMYQCDDGSCVPFSNYCDVTVDCKDGSDESRCTYRCHQDEFLCANGQCIASTARCDHLKQCFDGSDEVHCSQNEYKHSYKCFSERFIPEVLVSDGVPDCPLERDERDDSSSSLTMPENRLHMDDCQHGDQTCQPTDSMLLEWACGCQLWPFMLQRQCLMNMRRNYCSTPASTKLSTERNTSNHCMYSTGLVWKRSCRNKAHLQNCQNFDCPQDTHFKCPSSYCIPISVVCNGVWDCPYGSDEMECSQYTCPGFFKCKDQQKCLSSQDVCNGVPECLSGDDEQGCNTACPINCTCDNLFVDCSDKNLTDVSHVHYLVRGLQLRNNAINLTTHTLESLQLLAKLDLANNHIKSLQRGTFKNQINLFSLDLSGNDIITLSSWSFQGLRKLQYLHLQLNPIHTIHQNAFEELTSLPQLDLTGMNLVTIPEYAFVGLIKLKVLKLDNNRIRELYKNTFLGLHLRNLSLRGNHLQDPTAAFSGFINLSLYTDSFQLCCKAKHIQSCFPQTDEFSSCDNLIADKTLLALVWVLAVLIVLSTSISVLTLSLQKVEFTRLSPLYHLAFSDTLNVIHLFIIVLANEYFDGNYIEHEYFWRGHVLCRMAGVLTLTSRFIDPFLFAAIMWSHSKDQESTKSDTKSFLPEYLNKYYSVKYMWFLIIAVTTVLVFGGLASVDNGACYFNIYTHGIDIDPLTCALMTLSMVGDGILCVFVCCVSVRAINWPSQQFPLHDNVYKHYVTLSLLATFHCVPALFAFSFSVGGIKLSNSLSAFITLIIIPASSILLPGIVFGGNVQLTVASKNILGDSTGRTITQKTTN